VTRTIPGGILSGTAAQTGRILRAKNRPGKAHDSTQAGAFLRRVIDGLRTAFGRRLPVEFRMDAAFFQRARRPNHVDSATTSATQRR
jgi:hypothetical protein